MKYLLCITLIALLCVGISAQTASRTDEADTMKRAVDFITASKKRPSVDIVLRDMREINGKIVRVYDDSFAVEFKEYSRHITKVVIIGSVHYNPKPQILIRYSDVLQIEGKGVVLSFVPDPKLTPYSEWDAIHELGAGALLQVHTKDGKKVHGVFATSAGDRINLIQGNKQTEIARDDIVRIYQLAGNVDSLGTKLFGGGRRGRETKRDVMEIMDALVRVFPFGLPAAILVGITAITIMHVLPKRGVKRVLVFAI